MVKSKTVKWRLSSLQSAILWHLKSSLIKENAGLQVLCTTRAKVSLGLAQICLSGRLTTTDLLQDRAGASVSLVQLISSWSIEFRSFHRNIEQHKLEGTSKNLLVQLFVGKGAYMRLSSTLSHLEIFQWRGLYHFPGKVVPVTGCSHCKKSFSCINIKPHRTLESLPARVKTIDHHPQSFLTVSTLMIKYCISGNSNI